MVPKKSTLKEILPTDSLKTPEKPKAQDTIVTTPNETNLIDVKPEESKKVETIPEESKPVEVTPEASPGKAEMPSDFNEENCVVIDGIKVEIKPTKLKYFRNKGASAYGIIKAVPLHELLTYGKGIIDEKRDADQLLYDFLISVFDDSDFVRNHYDEIDAATIDRICKIFGRINHFDEKEEAARKNREAQAKR